MLKSMKISFFLTYSYKGYIFPCYNLKKGALGSARGVNRQ